MISKGRPEGILLPVVSRGPEPTYEDLDKAIDSSVRDALGSSKGKVGLLLSGGVDSTALLSYVLKYGKVPVFTVVTDLSHPDLEAAKRVAKLWGLEHHVVMPSKEDLDRAYSRLEGRGTIYPGDAAVYLALELAKEEGVDTILASDGLDEQMGGYWWHANSSDRFRSREEAFDYYWKVLDSEHLTPMLESAGGLGIEVKFPFLDRRVVSVTNRVPLDMRVKPSVPKSYWKEFVGSKVPADIVSRKKVGFVGALQEDITRDTGHSISWTIDYSKESVPRKRKSRSLKHLKGTPSQSTLSAGALRLKGGNPNEGR